MNSTKGSDKKNLKNARREKRTLLERAQSFFRTSHPSLLYYGMLGVVVIMLQLLIHPPEEEDLSKFHLDQPSPKIVTAPFDYEFVDEITTRRRIDERESQIAPVYNLHQENMQVMLQRVQNLAQAAKLPIEDATASEISWANSVIANATISLDNRIYELPQNSPDSLPRSTFEALLQYGANEKFWSAITYHIQTAAGRLGIADTIQPLRRDASAANSGILVGASIIYPDSQNSTNTQERLQPNTWEIRSYEEFIQRFQELVNNTFSDPVQDVAARELALDIVKATYAGPTLVYNKELTEQRRKEASSHVEPVIVQVNKGETIIGKNEMVSARHLQKMQALQDKMRISPIAEVGYFIFSLLFVALVLKYLKSYYKEISIDTNKIAVIFLAMLMLLAISKVAAFLSLLDQGTNTMRHIGYIIPMGALGVILTILASARLAVFCCALTAVYMELILFGYTGQSGLPYLIVAIVTSFGAIYTVTRIRRRSDLYRAGGIAILLAALVILAVSLQQYSGLEEFIQRSNELRWSLIWGAVNGALVSILAIALMPIFEDFYGVTTDIKLLELSQKNELLQRLEQEAPGSYQHTMRVATLAESAAEAIGANALLVRVGTYYHDIGKVVKPLYFVENQQSSADKAKHAKISPNMSCLIIRNHVKHGIELAEKYGLPKVIVDFIPEHHGTTLMTYFYHQALANQETEGTVKEEDFRYPGPKPQSKETAILMLSDSLEAASRVLEHATEREVRQLVRKIINERFMDGQFDECNLTLKDLHTLFQSYSESIIHMMHQRIAYPTLPPRGDRGEEGHKSLETTKTEKSTSPKSVSPMAIREKDKKEEKSQKPKDDGTVVPRNGHTILDEEGARVDVN